MQQRCGHSQVIWYDAVTIDGSLVWQNTLNGLNQPFLDACDAILINYSWKVPALPSRQLPAISQCFMVQ